MCKKIISFLVLSAFVIGTAVCAAPKTAEEVGKSFSPAVLMYNTQYDTALSEGDTIYGSLESWCSSRWARNKLESIATDIEKLSAGVLEEDVLKAKIAERDAKAADLEGASRTKKFFKEDEVKKLTSEIDTSIANKAQIEKLMAKIEPLTKQYTAALAFEEEMDSYIKETLENVAGFQFADDEKILATTKKTLDKREKKEKRQRNWNAVKDIFRGLDRLNRGGSARYANDVVSGSLDLLVSTLDDGKSDDDPKFYLVNNGYDDDMKKALKNATKSKSLVRVYLKVTSVVQDEKPLEGEAKRYPQYIRVSTRIMIMDEKGKIKKCVEGYVKSAVQSQEATKKDPNTLMSQIPDLSKECIEYVASNLHMVEKRKKNPGKYPKDVFRDVTVTTQKQFDNKETWFY